jgi:UDPglucose 6-dehydrogenase
MGKLKGKKISILGLAFKENTDDIRESTSISLINSLLTQKCKIFVHDPRALKNTYAVFKDQIKYTEQIKDNLKDSDCAIVMTPWEEYKKLTEKDFLKMKEPLIIDTRRILKIDNNKIRHVGLGIGK